MLPVQPVGVFRVARKTIDGDADDVPGDRLGPHVPQDPALRGVVLPVEVPELGGGTGVLALHLPHV
jgi:hypothetical protein